GVGEIDAAGRVALRADPHVVAPARVGQFDRRCPAAAEEGRGVHVPAALGGPTVLARPKAGAVPEGQPHAPFAVRLELRQLVELLYFRGQGRLELRLGLQPLAVHKAFDADAPGGVQLGARAPRVEEASVLAPLRAGLVPGRPQPPGPVAGQGDVGAEEARLLRSQYLA